MKTYDAIVVGSGCGMSIVEELAGFGASTALVDKGPLGGTCPNLGCIPSKMLIFPADRLMEMHEAARLGIKVEVKHIDFNGIMARQREYVRRNQAHMRQGVEQSDSLDFYEGEGHFVDDTTVEVDGEKIRGKKIFIASGSRPMIPPIKGLEETGYLTNESVLQLEEKPGSLIMLGGGAIAVEYAHFFAAMGVKVTMLELADRLVATEEREISGLLKQELSRRMDVYTNVQTEEVSKADGGVMAAVNDRVSGRRWQISADAVMVAVGRRSNADLLRAEKAGLELDGKGYIVTNEYLETNKKHIYAVGDANGVQMFTHVANREASIAFHNAIHGSRLKMDYLSAPHATYTWPEIASVGLTEERAREEYRVLTATVKYADVATGEIMREQTGYAKAVVDAATKNVLGFHIIGPYAPILIQEVINAIASGGGIKQVFSGMHIHPAQSELIPHTFSRLSE